MCVLGTLRATAVVRRFATTASSRHAHAATVAAKSKKFGDRLSEAFQSKPIPALSVLVAFLGAGVSAYGIYSHKDIEQKKLAQDHQRWQIERDTAQKRWAVEQEAERVQRRAQQAAIADATYAAEQTAYRRTLAYQRKLIHAQFADTAKRSLNFPLVPPTKVRNEKLIADIKTGVLNPTRAIRVLCLPQNHGKSYAITEALKELIAEKKILGAEVVSSDEVHSMQFVDNLEHWLLQKCGAVGPIEHSLDAYWEQVPESCEEPEGQKIPYIIVLDQMDKLDLNPAFEDFMLFLADRCLRGKHLSVLVVTTNDKFAADVLAMNNGHKFVGLYEDANQFPKWTREMLTALFEEQVTLPHFAAMANAPNKEQFLDIATLVGTPGFLIQALTLSGRARNMDTTPFSFNLKLLKKEAGL